MDRPCRRLGHQTIRISNSLQWLQNDPMSLGKTSSSSEIALPSRSWTASKMALRRSQSGKCLQPRELLPSFKASPSDPHDRNSRVIPPAHPLPENSFLSFRL
jgi:hypothetical protein